MNLGIVGSGMIVNELLSIIDELPQIKVVAIIGRKESYEKLKNLSKSFGITKIYTNYDDALDDPLINFMYIALPNHLHYSYTKKALLKRKNVICEKPFMSNANEAVEIIDIARNNGLYLFEAITNQFIPNYQRIIEKIHTIGEIKIVQCNYTQYSSRYDSFKKNIIHPVFDNNCAGGALMDINIYNLYFVVGIFGEPISFKYYPNVSKNIDTSGVLILEYPGFVSVCVGAKDSKSESSILIQGEKGYIKVGDSSNTCSELKIINDTYSNNVRHRMFYEFQYFFEVFSNKDYQKMSGMLDKTMIVMEILDKSKLDCEIWSDSCLYPIPN